MMMMMMTEMEDDGYAKRWEMGIKQMYLFVRFLGCTA
jgi:hypothetical protein